jgi:tetratricopeptide (TPR) repeat protein
MLSVMLTSCTSTRKDVKKVAMFLGIIENPQDVPLPHAPEEYKQALRLIEEEKFADALAILSDYMIQEPTSPYLQSASFHSARALEGLGRWRDASERYRGVVVACEGLAPRLQAMALYRLSFCWEALADDQQTVAVLFDLEKRSAELPKEILSAELPARLAAAYARVGNFDRAIDYYQKAETGIKQLKRTKVLEGNGSKAEVPSWLPRTLYFMGSMSLRHVSWSDFETAFRPLARSQTYLLEASELGMDPWSTRATKDLIGTYRDLWRTIEMAPVQTEGDPVVARREVQKKQWDRTVLIVETLAELKARFLPPMDGAQGPPTSEQTKELEGFVAEIDKVTTKFLNERPIGDGLTPDAKRRRAAPRGRVITPDSSLEQRFIESSRAEKEPTL